MEELNQALAGKATLANKAAARLSKKYFVIFL